jgi:hypothetical protein
MTAPLLHTSEKAEIAHCGKAICGGFDSMCKLSSLLPSEYSNGFALGVQAHRHDVFVFLPYELNHGSILNYHQIKVSVKDEPCKEPKPMLKLVAGSFQKIVDLNSKGKVSALLHLDYLSGVENDASGQEKIDTN